MTEMPVFLLHAVSPSKGFTGIRWLGPNPQSRENLAVTALTPSEA